MLPTLNLFSSQKLSFFFVCFLILLSCKPDDILLSSGNNIISINSSDDRIDFDFDATQKLITLTVPYDYSSEKIPVNLQVSAGAIHSLVQNAIEISGTTQITVTAEDGSVNTYRVLILKTKNDQNLLLNFEIAIAGVVYQGKIDQTTQSIVVDIPTLLDVSSISPEITISPNATLTPNIGTALNFENEIKYVVTSESGIERTYNVILNENKSEENYILSVKFPLGQSTFIEGAINQDTHEITITVPFLYDLETVVPQVEISERAEISFTSGTIFNFTNPVTFVVRAENGDERSYNIRVIREDNTENYILSFAFKVNTNEFIQASSINSLENSIHIEVPIGFSVSEVIPFITISENASLSPNSEQAQNFENQFKYTVTSENGISRVYTVHVTTEKSNANFITSFTIPNGDEILEGEIHNDKNTITLNIPFSYDLSSVNPAIEVSELALLSPESGTVQNFENQTNYNVTAENGDERVYTLTFKRGPNPEGILIEYKVSDGNKTYYGSIDNTQNIITLTVPFSFAYEKASILFNFSDNATVISSGDSLYNYKYLVISETGNRRLYTLDFIREANTENFITSFTVDIEGETIQGIIDNINNVITVQIPINTASTQTTPLVEVSENATFSPAVNSSVDISNTSYTVSAENGDLRFYDIVVERVKSSNNLISSFSLTIENQTYYGEIDHEKSEIRIRVPEGKNISQLTPTIEYHRNATVFPSEIVSQNFEENVIYSVAAENNELKNYTVIVDFFNVNDLTDNYSLSCDAYTNFSQWFGGDSRPEFYPRNVGAGIAIQLDNDIAINTFSIYLTNPFTESGSNVVYSNPITIKLDIRNSEGVIIATKNTSVNNTFAGGWVTFNLSNLELLLLKNVKYIFTMYVPDGDKIKVNTGIRGGVGITETGICYVSTYSAQYDANYQIDFEDWDSWYEKSYQSTVDIFFNFKITGKK